MASSSEAAPGRIVLPLSATARASADIENIQVNPVSELALNISLESEVERLSDMLIEEELLNRALMAERQTHENQESAFKEVQKRCESAELALLRHQSEHKEREHQLVVAVAELDSARLIILRECEELKELLCDERERSVRAAVDHEAHAAERKRRCEELERSLQEAQEQSDSTSRELVCAQADNSNLTAQLRESGVAHQERCDALAASVHAAEQEHKAVQQQLEEAVREVLAVKGQLQGSAEREAAACARVSVLEGQVAASAAAASAELDNVRRSLMQECEELKELLSDERERSSELHCQLRFSAVQCGASDRSGSSIKFEMFPSPPQHLPGYLQSHCHRADHCFVETESQTDLATVQFDVDLQRYIM